MLVHVTSLLLFASAALSSPLVVHEKRGTPPRAWTYSHRVSTDAILPLRIGLAQANIHNLESLLMEVAHPDSPEYGRHWTAQRVAETFAPSTETVKTVGGWLEDEGISSERIRLSAGRNWMEVNATVEEIERLLDAEYHVYTHSRTGEEHIACSSYSVPEHIRDHVELITPTVHFDRRQPTPKTPVVRRKRENAPVPGANRNIGRPGAGNPPKSTGPQGNISSIISQLETCDQAITPDCLRALYDIVYTPVSTDKNSFAIVEYTPQAYIPSDLDMFFGMFDTSLVGTRPTMVSIDGGVVQQTNMSFDYNGESDLDLEYSMTLVDPQPITLYQTGDLVEGASFNNLLDALDGTYCTYEGGDDPTQDGIYPDPYPGGYTGPEDCGTVKPANVISTSYASDEADATPFYNIRQCNEYGKLGLMGVTILYSSGDEGVAGNDNYCLNADGTQTANGTLFNPLYPAVCPYVTAVGATQVNPNTSVFAPESACEQVIYSGGGFSNVFARPSYQAEAVDYYLTNYFPTDVEGRFNNSGSRGFPDLAANGANYVIAIDGEFELVYGTSCASPVVGSILTLINDARIAVGKAPIGFINPTIYTEAFRGAFNDITMGGNQGCGTPGFESVPGWDPVTGLGTPNFLKLLALWLALP